MPLATVKWFNNKSGIGFLVDPLIEGDIFVHHSVIEGDGYKILEPGEEVEYEMAVNERGVCAVRVARLDGMKQ
jgi:CspA family cold shock protein